MSTNCQHCGAVTPVNKRSPQKPRRFCSSTCSQAAWVKAHPDRRQEILKKYDLSEKAQKRRRAWEKKNVIRLKDARRKNYLKDRALFIERAAKRAKENPGLIASYKKKYAATERGRQTALDSRWNRIAREKNVGGRVKASDFDALCAQFMDHCAACLDQFPRHNLTRDHVMPICDGGANVIENIQPLCMVCNRAKRTESTDYRPGFWVRAGSKMMAVAA